MFGVSRTVYYKYQDRYITYGIKGLKDKEKSVPVMPNAAKANVVDKVFEIAKRYPAYGPARLANELGNIVCCATVYNILRRHNLSKKFDRLLPLQDIPSTVKISPIMLRKLALAKPAQIFSPRPGYILSVDTFYEYTLKGVGRIYQFPAIDTNSSFGAAYLYADKSAASAVDFMARTIALFKALAIIVCLFLTDNGKEYTSHWGNAMTLKSALLKQELSTGILKCGVHGLMVVLKDSTGPFLRSSTNRL